MKPVLQEKKNIRTYGWSSGTHAFVVTNGSLIGCKESLNNQKPQQVLDT